MNPLFWKKEMRQLMPVVVCPTVGLLMLLTFFEWTRANIFELGLAWLLFLAAQVTLVSAYAFGSEFSNGTIDSLMGQPVSRHWLWRLKAKSVLAGCLVVWLAYIGWLLLFANVVGQEKFMWNWYFLETILIPSGISIIWGLGAGSLFTILTRNGLAGAFLGLSLATLGYFVPSFFPEWESTFVQYAVVWLTVTVVILGLGRRSFLRYQSRAVLMQDLDVPILGGLFPAQYSRAWQALLFKELRLQTVNVAMAIVVVVATLILLAAKHDSPPRLIYTGFLLLMGLVFPRMLAAAAFAGENENRTLQSQQTLPVSLRKQWIVKIAVVYGLSLLLATAAPMLVNWIANPNVKELNLVPMSQYAFLLMNAGFTSGAIFASAFAASTLNGILLGMITNTVLGGTFVGLVSLVRWTQVFAYRSWGLTTESVLPELFLLVVWMLLLAGVLLWHALSYFRSRYVSPLFPVYLLCWGVAFPIVQLSGLYITAALGD